MKKPLFKPRQLLVLAYLLAAVFWVVRCLVGCGVMLNYQLQGKMPQTHLDAADLVTESFAPYSSNEWWTPPDDDPAWYLSTDSDPRIYWQGQGYIETVVLDAAHRLPPGGVALYYLKPGQTDYTEAQKVFARVTAPGVYTFDLGGKWVTGLRIDPDSVGGVPTLFTGIELNPVRPWYLRFVPSAGWWLVLAFVPAVAGFWLGILFLLLLDHIIPHLHRNSQRAEGPKSQLKRTTMLVLAVTLHNIPEGMAVGVVYAGYLAGSTQISAAAAMALSLGIAIQNFPEGAIISMPLRAEGTGKPKAFLGGVLSGIVEPIGAILTILAAGLIVPALPYLLSFAAGAMLYVVVEELIPEMSQGEHSDVGTIFFAVGFSVMMMLDVALG